MRTPASIELRDNPEGGVTYIAEVGTTRYLKPSSCFDYIGKRMTWPPAQATIPSTRES